MREKIFVITGGNSGIGRVTATEIAKTGAQVVLVCRNEQKGRAVQEDINALTGLNNCDLFLCDFSSHTSIKEFAKNFRMKYNSIDVLINNAGAIIGERQVNDDGLEMMFATNHLGYFLMTHYLFDLLKASDSARVVNVASLAHRFTNMRWVDLQAEKSFNSWVQYGHTKLMNILFNKELAYQLKKNTNITANCLHPGNINSNFGKTGNSLMQFLTGTFGFVLTSPQQGAETSIYLATSPLVQGKTGLYWYKKNPTIPSLEAISSENARRLWDISLKLTGIKVFGEVDFE
ncbi:MAG TPA: SDR family oxidoreductase [Chitinophagales bacterium]|jgi:NAD(P)-dependent dehydrogenase (short-subunit alcohol dehydrogenase family)|nr:SDR family oxidoreductase [Chitinophagales bacterium]HQG37627.1 SDR family oxidoreductase [Chitinophagales bacterium]